MRSLALLAAGFGLARVPPAAGQPTLTLEAGSVGYRAEERIDGVVADAEAGRLARAGLSLAGSGGAWRWQGGFDRRQGTVGYDGHSQFGLPLRSHTTLVIDEPWLGIGLAHRTLAEGPWTWAAELRGGQRRLERRIAPSLFSTPLDEVLHWRWLRVGAELARPLGDGWTVGAAMAREQGLQGWLEVDFHGVYEPGAVTLGHGRPGWWSALTAGRQSADGRFTLALRWTSARFDYGESAAGSLRRAGLEVGQFSYPGSRQRQIETTLALAWRW